MQALQSILIFALITLLALPSVEGATDRQIKKESQKSAQQWVSFTIASKKKMLTAAKKVKAGKDVPDFRDCVNSIYKAFNAYDGVLPMGRCEPPAAPSGPCYDEAFEKKGKQIDSLDEALEKELQRLKDLNIASDAMQEALFKAKLILGLMGA